MQMRSEILLLFCGVILLCASCGTAKKVQKNNSKETTTTTTTTTTITESEPEPVEISMHPPVYIEGGFKKKVFYVGMPNTIKIYAEGGSTAHLDVFVSGGKIAPIDVTKGLYSFTERVHGLAVEVVAKDTVSGVVVTEIFDVVQIPAPEAYVWTYRKILKGNYTEFKLEDFKAQNAVILQHKEKIPARCNATNYTVTHINAAGKRTMHKNENKSGLFDETTLAMVSLTEKGDVFIFENIKTACSPLPIKSIFYVIK
jgi:hypothetical protein